MGQGLKSVTTKQARCKCCGALALAYGVVDFHKNCELHRGKMVLDISGVPIYYHRCPVCHFIFTTAFDHFTMDDFLQHIYNDDYIMVDPDYQEGRPKGNAAWLRSVFSQGWPRQILDYGGGNGALAQALQAAGFDQVVTYDPFVPDHCSRPAHRFDCIVSFEVLEHSTAPARTIADMSEFLQDPGLIIFSTLVQPENIDQQGLNWWYAGPRNGHVSLYSKMSLAILGQAHGFNLGSFNHSIHVFFREIPEFATHLIKV
jgi:2-polyprenyl-6-hydroxyphenyl methylase/3-demethylubiquinone-9 3-methyltransferase